MSANARGPLPAALGPALSPDALAARERLPRKPAAVELSGRRARLRPTSLAADLDALFDVSCGRAARVGDLAADAYDADAAIWRYMSSGPFADASALGAWLAPQIAAADGLCLTVLDAATSHPVGVVNYLANHPEHLKVELGSIWYAPLVQGTGLGAEVTYLLLEHAFSLGYRRVEWKCDALNERSRRAALRMGFRFEGIQEAHYIVKGRSRDTAWFRMLDVEWPALSPRLRALFEGRFDPA
jgi:RimJ/RimL family protein N-acetyltransferase